MVLTVPEVNFSDQKPTSMATKTLIVYQEALFAKPEVTTFWPEVKFLKPEVRPMTLTKILLYPETIFSERKWLKMAFLLIFEKI